MAKKIGLVSATFLGLTSILGSGWLFAAYRAAQVAGPAAIFAWIIAMVMIALLAFCLIEVVSRYPIRGLSAVIPFLTHNKHFGFPFAIANWLGVVAVVGLEAEAVVQYLIHLVPTWSPQLFSHGHFTTLGDLLAIGLVIVFTLLNFWGARMMTRVNNVLSVLKLIIPIVVGLAVIGVAFHPAHFSIQQGHFIPYGVGSIFTAILSTGIIIAFNGFQTVVSFASEVDKPARTIGWSIILALLLALGVYLLLQIAFIGGVPTPLLSHGWAALKMQAPILELVGMIGLGMLTSIIYFGSVIAPAGTGIAFVGAATRMFTAMSRKGQMPSYFNAVHTLYNVSRRSLLVNMILAILFIAVFRSWSSLAQVLSLFHIISYLPILLAVWVLRKQFSGMPAAYRMPGGLIVSVLLFIFFTCLLTQADWPLIREVLGMFLTFQCIYIICITRSVKQCGQALKNSAGLLLFFGGIGVLVWCKYAHTLYAFTSLQYILASVVWAVISFAILYYQANGTPPHDAKTHSTG